VPGSSGAVFAREWVKRAGSVRRAMAELGGGPNSPTRMDSTGAASSRRSVVESGAAYRAVTEGAVANTHRNERWYSRGARRFR